ncbi:nucleoid-associated protein [Enterococcus timonensis]|uniref:nucleoid-associated protein n=1 Tax=Enterococcus timonensis TaxID=1852364 RepID=UPI0008DB1DE6|nr:nucleoid-associated protein [Enterococcus timonensis]
MDIYLKKAVLEIVDRNSGTVVTSSNELDLTNSFVREFLEKKISALHSSKTKVGTLSPGAPFTNYFQQLPENFIESAGALTKLWDDVYQESEEAPSCDLFIVSYEEDAKLHGAFLKVNYQESYTHFLDSVDGQISNELILHKALLGSKSQKADEGLTVNLETLAYQLQEKKYVFSGEKIYYFSQQVIGTVPAPSLEENIRVIKKAAEKVGAQFSAEKYDTAATVKEAVVENIQEVGAIAPEKIAQKIFHDNPAAQNAFQESLADYGFETAAPLISEVKEITEKKYGKQKLKLSNGIELIVPLEIYKDPEKIEFVNNPDGTISVILKNIDEVVNKF